MVEPYTLIISFIAGDMIEITGVMDHRMENIGDCVYLLDITNGCICYINFSTVKYISRNFNLKQKQ